MVRQLRSISSFVRECLISVCQRTCGAQYERPQSLQSRRRPGESSFRLVADRRLASLMTDGAQSSRSCEAPFQVRRTTGIGHLICTLTEEQLLRKLKWCYRPIAVVSAPSPHVCFAAGSAGSPLLDRIILSHSKRCSTAGASSAVGSCHDAVHGFDTDVSPVREGKPNRLHISPPELGL